jgi:GrpB-like predicted nucleotidyltransferase (UPF0157 family)
LQRWAISSFPARIRPDFHFFAKPAEATVAPTARLRSSEHEFRHLAVRDFLRTHNDEAAYASLKREVVAKHPQGRLAYIEGKDDYVVDLERRATEWARNRS